MLKVYNTQTRKMETFHSRNRIVTLYTCGPTVYDYAHIGNFRTYVFEDLLRRTLLFLGYEVKQVMNITDVDDKTIKGAIGKEVSLEQFTKPYEEAFFNDLKTLHIQPAEEYPKATAYIDQMITIILELLKKGFAYKAKDGSIYFSIKKFSAYGKLSHLDLENLQADISDRVPTDEYEKQDAADFALWKSYDPSRDGSIFWDSPFGKGRPGWHIECSAMALHLLGETIDFHCGGVDNIFPHHENEKAQSEAYTNKPFVRYWMHAAHLIVENRKMSKSLGNFFVLKNLLDNGFSGVEIRYMLMHVHYRTQLNFTIEGLEACHSSIQRIRDFLHRMKMIDREVENEQVIEKIGELEKSFKESLCDDLNISSALANLFDFIRDIHILCDENRVGKNHYSLIISLFSQLDRVLGFLPLIEEEKIPQEVIGAKTKRDQARKEKRWTDADVLREFILTKGYVVEDGPDGSFLKKK